MIAQVERTDDSAVRGLGDVVKIGNVGLGLAVVAAVCGLVGGRIVDSDQVDGYGLISALPSVYWAGVALAVAATFLLLRVAASNERSRYAPAVPALWLLLLHTAPQLAHSHVRFSIVWTHMGFVRLIDETRTGDVLIDARFAWPGFFGTFIAPLARLDPWALEGLLRVWPTYITGGTAILVAALARRSYPTVPMIGSLSALVYVLLAWTGQDYFSPQSAGFLWYIAILVILESGPLQTSSAWSASVPVLPRFAASGGDRPASRSTPAFVALVILSFGAVVSHPLAPFFICMALVILGLYGRTLAWRLLLFVGSAYVLWFLVSAEPWWSTRIEELMDQFGGLLDNFARNTSERVATSSPEHLLVTSIRSYVGLATFVSVLVIGITMATERFRHLRPAVPLAPLAGVPALAVALQSYGGEIVIRVLLFTLPMASVLIGRILASFRLRTLPTAVALLTAALCPLLLVARFGNERFEFTTAPDREAVEVAYARADDDTLFVADNGFISWRDQTVGRNEFFELTVDESESWITAVEAEAMANGKERIIVVLTDSQLGWKVHGESLPADTLDNFAQWLLDRSGSELLFHDGRSWTIEL